MAGEGLPSIDLHGMRVAAIDRRALLDHVFGELTDGRGGWLITANLDFLRRHARDRAIRRIYDRADVIVADGMPLVWAAALQGEPLPERVAGSSLLIPLARRAAREGRSLFLLGGASEATPEAARLLRTQFPDIQIRGVSTPFIEEPPTEENLASVRAELLDARPDLLLVGLGSPKQEYLIDALRPALPHTWMVGVGISFSFVSGHVQRAPAWMRRTGLEWVHRLAQEPRRLARRYLVDDIPFALELLSRAAARRARTPPTRAT